MLRETPAITIGGRRVANDTPPFILAEIGLNHGGSVPHALELVDAAAAAGADGIKLQSLVAPELVAPACPAPAHVSAASLVDFFARFELDEDAHRRIAEHAWALGLRVVSTPFSERAVDMLERIGIDAYKIASGDLTFDQLIVRCAATGKPLILSTGMSLLDEVRYALAIARLGGAVDLALLHCVSAYPVPAGSENLLAIRTLATEFRVAVGLSDHAPHTASVPIAVALGATLYERHLRLDTDDNVVDRAVSSTPAELAGVVDVARRAWASLGSGRKVCLEAEAPNRVPSRRALCATRPLPAGAVLAPGDLIALRPAIGLSPSSLPAVVGQRLARSLNEGEALTDAHLSAGAGEHPRVA